MKNFFLFSNLVKDPGNVITGKLKAYIEEHGGSCGLFSTDRLSNLSERCIEIPPETECIMVLGGDGTFIEAVGALACYELPFVGINLGNLGYLTECDSQNMFRAVDRLMEGSVNIGNRMMIDGAVMRDGERIHRSFSLNDVVISRSGDLRVIHFNLLVNGVYLNNYTADGIIISTPTGSTAYNLSAGGPILFPEGDLMVVTPICPHTLSTRSMVLPADVTVEIELLDEDEIAKPVVVFDGGDVCRLHSGDKVVIARSELPCKLIKLNNVTFIETLRAKMRSI